MIVKKINDEVKKIGPGEAVDMASWVHNPIVNVLGFQPLPLVTGKSLMIPGLTMGDMATDSLYDDEMIRKILEHYHIMMKEFRELEYSMKLKGAIKTRIKGYEDTKEIKELWCSISIKIRWHG